MQRGEVRRHQNIIQREGAADFRLIVASTPIAGDDGLATVMTLLVFDDDPGGLLSVRCGDVGFASALRPEATVRRRLGEVVHVLTEEERQALDAAMQVGFFDP